MAPGPAARTPWPQLGREPGEEVCFSSAFPWPLAHIEPAGGAGASPRHGLGGAGRGQGTLGTAALAARPSHCATTAPKPGAWFTSCRPGRITPAPAPSPTQFLLPSPKYVGTELEQTGSPFLSQQRWSEQRGKEWAGLIRKIFHSFPWHITRAVKRESQGWALPCCLLTQPRAPLQSWEQGEGAKPSQREVAAALMGLTS